MLKTIELLEKVKKLLDEIKDFIESQKNKSVESTRFKTLSDGWVLDKALGIEWGPSSEKQMNWEYAKKYAADKGGRLPTTKELHSLVDYDKNNPAIDTRFFSDTKTNDYYWTKTEVSGCTSCAWCVFFSLGYVNFLNKDYNNYVRPVREIMIITGLKPKYQVARHTRGVSTSTTASCSTTLSSTTIMCVPCVKYSV